jgi:asparagine synthase (glutamine-hydrolysing)
MCELAGVEVGFPLLDEKLVEFSARLPPHLKLKRTQLRYFFKRALRDFLPAPTLTKTKHGFGLPFGTWLYTHRGLQELARDNLNGLAKRGIIQKRFVDELMDVLLPRHPHYYGTFTWVLLMLEQWFEAHVDRRSASSRANNSAAGAPEKASESGPKG